MRLEGGYKTQTIVQLANVLAAFNRRQISFRAFRLYFAALAAVAAREAASRVSSKRRCKTNRYELCELARLSACRRALVRSELRSLERAGLLLYSESLISFTSMTLPGSEALCAGLAAGRSSRRPVPIPRAALRFIAACNSAAMSKTMLAYCIRGLTLTREGEVRGKGTAKASWIAEAFGISLRAVRLARADLIARGFISRDVGSKQWKLNRDGAYFAVNLSFRTRGGSPRTQPHPAPPAARHCTPIAPPYKDMKTPYGLKDQRTRSHEHPGSQREGREPDLRNVQIHDIRKLHRLNVLYRQAVNLKWLAASERNYLNFVAAAIRANRAGGDSVRIFISIVRRGLWSYISNSEEDRARELIKRDGDRAAMNSSRCVLKAVLDAAGKSTTPIPLHLRETIDILVNSSANRGV